MLFYDKTYDVDDFFYSLDLSTATPMEDFYFGKFSNLLDDHHMDRKFYMMTSYQLFIIFFLIGSIHCNTDGRSLSNTKGIYV